MSLLSRVLKILTGGGQSGEAPEPSPQRPAKPAPQPEMQPRQFEQIREAQQQIELQPERGRPVERLLQELEVEPQPKQEMTSSGTSGETTSGETVHEVEATEMQYQPEGLQPAPSPGPGTGVTAVSKTTLRQRQRGNTSDETSPEPPAELSPTDAFLERLRADVAQRERDRPMERLAEHLHKHELEMRPPGHQGG